MMHFVLMTLPNAMIKHPNESNEKENGLTRARSLGLQSLLAGESQAAATLKQVVILHPQ